MKKKKGIMGDLFDNYDEAKKNKKKEERKEKRKKFWNWIKENPEAAYAMATSALATSTAIIIKITNTVHKINEEKRANEIVELRRMEQERLEAQRLERLEKEKCDIYDRKDNMHYTTTRPLTNKEKNDIKVRQQNTGERMYDILEEMGVLK
jgi:hypothetical protein